MKKTNRNSKHRLAAILALVGAGIGSPAWATSHTWIGVGGDADWGTAGNWDSLPAFDNTSDITIGTAFTSGLNTTVGTARSINSLSINSTDAFSIGGSNLTLLSGSLGRVGGNINVISSNLILGANGSWSIGGDVAGRVEVTGAVGETGGARSLTIDGARNLWLMGADTYTGATIQNNGQVRYGGTSQTSGFTLNGGSALLAANDPLGSGTWTINGGGVGSADGTRYTVSNPVSLSGSFGTSGSSRVTFSGAATLTTSIEISNNNDAGSANGLEFTSGIGETGGSHGVTFASGNTRYVTLGASTYTGPTTINSGTLRVTAANATSSVTLTGGAIEVADAAGLGAGTFTVNNATLIADGAQSISNSTVMGDSVAISSGSYNWTFTNQVTLNSNLALDNGTGGLGAVFSGGFTESGGARSLTVTGGPFRVIEIGGSSNYTGGTTVSSSYIRLVGNNALPTNTALVVDAAGSGGLLLNGYNQQVGSLSGPGDVNLSNKTLTVNGPGSGTFSGTLTGSGGSLAVTGSGNLSLTGTTNTYTGGTTVTGGTLLANNTSGSATGTGAVSVTGTGVLGGGNAAGTAGFITGGLSGDLVTVSSGGKLAPGNSTGILTVTDTTPGTGNAVAFSSGGVLAIELNGTTVGVGYDQLNVSGAIALGSGTLQVTLGYLPAPGDRFWIISNDDADSISGVFANLLLDDVSMINVIGPDSQLYYFRVSYDANWDPAVPGNRTINGGNDVVLENIEIPEPASFGLLALGGVTMLRRRRA